MATHAKAISEREVELGRVAAERELERQQLADETKHALDQTAAMLGQELRALESQLAVAQIELENERARTTVLQHRVDELTQAARQAAMTAKQTALPQINDLEQRSVQLENDLLCASQLNLALQEKHKLQEQQLQTHRLEKAVVCIQTRRLRTLRNRDGQALVRVKVERDKIAAQIEGLNEMHSKQNRELVQKEQHLQVNCCHALFVIITEASLQAHQSVRVY
jgi:hypothetical protein